MARARTSGTSTSSGRGKSAARKGTASVRKGASAPATATSTPVRKGSTAGRKGTSTASTRRTAPTTTGRTRSTAPERQPDALDILVADHREVERLAAEYERLGPGDDAARREVAEAIFEALTIHAGIEEVALYPSIRATMSDLDPEVLESLEEHHVVKSSLAELMRLSIGDERFDAKLKVLLENVRHHVDEEEKELFPQLRRRMDAEELRDMGRALDAARGAVPRMPHPHAPDEPPGNTIAALLTAPIDIAGRVVRRVLASTE